MPSDLPTWPLAVPRAGHVAVALAVKEKMVKVYSGRVPPGEIMEKKLSNKFNNKYAPEV